MMIWTVMFGDDPLSVSTRGSASARIRIFNSRRTAYAFKEACREAGVFADVVHHPRRHFPTFH